MCDITLHILEASFALEFFIIQIFSSDFEFQAILNGFKPGQERK